MRTPEEGIRDLQEFKAAGFKGAMLPGEPGVADYDDEIYDPFYEAAVDLDMPLSFHILTSGKDSLSAPRGNRLNAWNAIIRGCQDIMGLFVFGGVFERHPKLKVVCVEADAGWVPHFLYRMDHGYNRHRHWMQGKELSRLPSEYFKENIYLTFQDDWTAFKVAHLCNVERLMWANDFPHSDSTWPWSQELLAEHTADMSVHDRDRILHDNCAELYGLKLQ